MMNDWTSLQAPQGQSCPAKKGLAVLLLMTIGFIGCQTAPRPAGEPSRSETVSAITSVTQGLTNKTVTEEQLKDISLKVAKDPQAKSALKSIDTAFSPQHTVKYCPENGQRFSPDMDYCPDGKVKLEWVD